MATRTVVRAVGTKGTELDGLSLEDMFTGHTASAVEKTKAVVVPAPNTFLLIDDPTQADYDKAGIAYFSGRYRIAMTDRAGWLKLVKAFYKYTEQYPSEYVNKYGQTVHSVDLFLKARKEATIAAMRTGKLAGCWYGLALAFHSGKPSKRLDDLMA